MKKTRKKWRRPLLFALGGAAVGYLYHRFVGCASGTCAIASSPVNSMLCLGLAGWLLPGVFERGRSGKCSI